MPKIVVTDHTFEPLDIEQQILQTVGGTIDAHQCKSPSRLAELVADADAVITQFAPVNAQVIAAMNQARVIVRYGIGVDNVDLDAARAHAIPVCNVPDYCIAEVADHTLAFILALTRQVVPHSLHLRGGNWGLAVPLAEMKALRDLTFGVVGFGRIGRAVVRRLVAFGGAIAVYDPVVPPAEIQRAGVTAAESLDDLLQICDVLTLHCPSTPWTRGMINEAALARMKRGSILINLARGDLIETAALVEALREGRLAGAALDVCDPEPIPPDHPLLQMPNVVLAPHIASASPNSMQRLRETVARTAATALRGVLPPNVVNGVTQIR